MARRRFRIPAFLRRSLHGLYREHLAAAVEAGTALEQPHRVGHHPEREALALRVDASTARGRTIATDAKQIEILDIGLLARDRVGVDRIDLDR